MTDVGLECKHFKNHVENADNNRGAQKIDVSVQKDFFDHLELCAVSASRWKLTCVLLVKSTDSEG
jgi:hypothetical protein